MAWIFCSNGDEDRVKERLIYRLPDDFTVIVPKRKLRLRKGGIWRVETKVLFPGYVFDKWFDYYGDILSIKKYSKRIQIAKDRE